MFKEMLWVLITLCLLCAHLQAFCEQARKHPQELDAGVWLKVNSAQKNAQGKCPQKFYLGARGSSYASGVLRTAALREFVDSIPKAVRLEKNEILFEAPLKRQYLECHAIARSDSDAAKMPFQGEVYIFSMKDGKITFNARAGSSLFIENARVFQNQVIFKIAESL